MVAAWVWVDACELVVEWFAGCVGWCVGWLVPPTPTPPTTHQLSVWSDARQRKTLTRWVCGSPRETKQFPGVNNNYIYVCAKTLINNPKWKHQQLHQAQTKISSFYEDVYILLLYRFALNSFSSWKRWVELKLLRAGHRRKGSNRSGRRKRKHALGWYSRHCRRDIWRGLPAVLETLEHDSGDLKALWSQSIYRYVLQYIVDNARRHDTDFRRKLLFNDLSY